MDSEASSGGARVSFSEFDLWTSTQNAVADLGTPLYLFRPNQVRLAYHRMLKGLQRWGKGTIAYSLKTNSFFGILGEMRKLGSWAEVVSSWEYQLALAAGFRSETIIFNGPLKTSEALQCASRNGVFSINIDSVDELAYLATPTTIAASVPRVGVRGCLRNGNSGWSRFGLQIETGEFEHTIQTIKESPDLELACLHFHLGTQVNSVDRYLEALAVAQDVWERLELGPHVRLDLGGGYPYQHDRPLEDQEFDPVSFFETLKCAWQFSVRPPLLIEPGRYIVAPAIALVGRVLSCKERAGEPSIIVLDTGTNHNVMGAFYEHQWLFERVDSEVTEFRLCGPLCMEDDIMSGPIRGNRPQCGSLTIMLNAGAYSMSLSRTFIQPRPAVVQVLPEGRYELMVKRETPQSAFALNRGCRRRICQQ